MTNLRAYIFPILAIFVIIALFGSHASFLGMATHEMDCPFSPDGAAVCAQPLAHISHWQNMFAAIIVEILVLGIVTCTTLLCLFRYATNSGPRFALCRSRPHVPIRPTLLQELFADGILNRRAP